MAPLAPRRFLLSAPEAGPDPRGWRLARGGGGRVIVIDDGLIALGLLLFALVVIVAFLGDERRP
jgi:hypothetical protein